MSAQRSVAISHWLKGEPCNVTIWPLSEGKDRHVELDGRLTIFICSGICTCDIRPTAAEARALIELLQWALEAEQEAA